MNLYLSRKYMKAGIMAFCLVVSLFLFISCATIASPQMTYVGDATPLPNVEGVSTSYNIFGIGVSADSYADEYNTAIQRAFKQCSPDIKKLSNVKVYQVKKTWPQLLGMSAMVLGSSLISVAVANTDTIESGSLLFLLGALSYSITITDFVVLGEPVTTN